MRPILHKRLLWIVVIWFAILQAFSPLIHAHIEADTPVLGHGLHLHVQEQEASPVYDQTPTLKNWAGGLHTIGVDNALIEDTLFLSAPLLVLSFALYSLVLLCLSYRLCFNLTAPHPLRLRPQAGTRAPPRF